MMMGSLSGMHRQVVAVSAVALASVSAEIHDKLRPSKTLSDSSDSSLLQQSDSSLSESNSSWVSRVSVSKLADLSFVARIRVPVPSNVKNLVPYTCRSVGSSVGLPPGLINLYQSAEVIKAPKPAAYTYTGVPSSSPSEVSCRWHLPEPQAVDVSGSGDSSAAKCNKTVVVLLGWLGAKQKHLSKYAEWYTSRGYHAITFTFPMSDILSYQVGGKAEQDVELLVNHLADWLEEEEHEKNLVFHTFSNTGWLTYGVMLEKFQHLDPSLIKTIKGCVVDSAPVAVPDPQVWASGFSAAFLKKHSVATKGLSSSNETEAGNRVENRISVEAKPAAAEAALLVLLKKFFEVVLNIPTVNRRLSDVMELLTTRQPSCPQLYIYSSADKVIPAGSVESFIEAQRNSGREVRACNFISTPHVDHFRNDPNLYTSQLTKFFDDCVLSRCNRP